MTAAVNLQLRFSPAMLALRALLDRQELGTLTDIDLRLVIEQPWHLWKFMIGAPRLELVYHSIHYLDAIRSIAGEPQGAYCRAVGHPDTPQLRDTRSSIILDYGDALRCSLVMNHTHRAGPRHRTSELMVEGTNGAARLVLGVNLDYPTGSPDEMEVAHGQTWTRVPLRGSWFTEAFEGPMSNLQRFIAGEDVAPREPGRGHDQNDGTRRGVLPIERARRNTDTRRTALTRGVPRQGAVQHENRRAPALLAVRSRRVRLDRRLDGGAEAGFLSRGPEARDVAVLASIEPSRSRHGRHWRRRAGFSISRAFIHSLRASSAGSISSRRRWTRSWRRSRRTRDSWVSGM